MISGKAVLRIKNVVKSTSLGRMLRDRYQRRGLDSKEAAEKTVRKYLGDDIDKAYLTQLVSDMLSEAKKHDVAFYEYMMYHFYDMSDSERREYVSSLERITCCERMNHPKNVIVFDDKGKTYQVYKKYYKRELIEIPWGGDRIQTFC